LRLGWRNLFGPAALFAGGFTSGWGLAPTDPILRPIAQAFQGFMHFLVYAAFGHGCRPFAGRWGSAAHVSFVAGASATAWLGSWAIGLALPLEAAEISGSSWTSPQMAQCAPEKVEKRTPGAAAALLRASRRWASLSSSRKLPRQACVATIAALGHGASACENFARGADNGLPLAYSGRLFVEP
jgi:hypothetical protein